MKYLCGLLAIVLSINLKGYLRTHTLLHSKYAQVQLLGLDLPYVLLRNFVIKAQICTGNVSNNQEKIHNYSKYHKTSISLS